MKVEQFSNLQLKALPEAGVPLDNVIVMQTGYLRGHYAVEVNGRLTTYNSNNPRHAKLDLLPILVDAITLSTIADSGNTPGRKEIKSKINHTGDVTAIIGGYKNFRTDKDAVRASFSIAEKSKHRDYVLELTERFHSEIGNSVDFDPVYEKGKDEKGKPIALVRCKKLNSVDLVDAGAATNALYERGEEDEEFATKNMDKEPQNEKEPSLKDVLAAVTESNKNTLALSKKVDELAEKHAALEEKTVKLSVRTTTEEEEEEEEPTNGDVLKALHEMKIQLSKSQVLPITGEAGLPSKAARTFEDEVKLQLEAGARNRNHAVQIAAQLDPAGFNVWRTKQ